MKTESTLCRECKENARTHYSASCLPCLRIRARKWRAKNPGYDTRAQRLWNYDIDAWFRNKFMLLRNNAKSRNQEFTITIDDLKKEYTEFCPILGLKLVYLNSCKRGRKLDSPSVDRIDSTKGYIPGNIWIISVKANMCKSDLTLEGLKNLYEQTLKKINDQTAFTS